MTETNQQQAPQMDLNAFSQQLADVVERAAKSIVTVAGRPRQAATGILWQHEQETVVLTADHVVERDEQVQVTLPDGRQVAAQLVGRDPSTDLAVLRLPGTELGTSNVAAEAGGGLRAGNLVVAIGRPGADGPRVSLGTVSAIGGPRRSWQGGEIEGVIYADVTLYPGFSGGPLIDLAGRVVGLNSSRLTRQNSSAVPTVTLRRVAATLLTHGRVRRGYLGIGTQQVPLPASLAQRAGLSQETALLVVSVEQGSPAEQAGLFIGDLLTALGGAATSDVDALRAQLGSDKVGQPVQAKILRGGEPKDVQITIAERA